MLDKIWRTLSKVKIVKVKEGFNMKTNQEIFEQAKNLMVGGGCAGGRINRVLGRPLYIDHAKGCRIYTTDGEEFIDFHTGAGAMMFGFKNPRIEKALQECIDKGFFMNFESEKTLELAKLFTTLVPTAEKIRITNSGTEATMAAIRAARAYTGKNLIIKMDGHFHGMHENIWYHGGYGTDYDEFGETKTVVPAVPGFPANGNENLKLIKFNDIDAVKHAFEKYRGKIAAIIMEPVNYDCGCVLSTKEYMQQVRELCTKEGILLIYDEVISGARFRPGSAQGYYGIKPDLSTFAKAVANGFSLAIVAGKAEVMDVFNPVGPVTCSGTSSGNLMSVMASIECLKMALEPGFYDKIEHIETKLIGGMNDLFKKYEIPGHAASKGARFALYFGYDDPQIDYDLSETVKLYNDDMYKKFVAEAINEKLYFNYSGKMPFPHHSGFGIAHTDADLDEALDRMDRVFAKIK